jgi:serine protease inhibitor
MDNSLHPRGATYEEAITPTVRQARLWHFDLRTLFLFVYGFLLAAGAVRHAQAQEAGQAQPAIFLRANDRFGFELLRAAHEERAGSNIVLSPLPISLAFAIFWDRGADHESAGEIGVAFHWGGDYTPSAAKMILQRFEKPKPRPVPSKIPLGMNRTLRLLSGNPEEVWLSAAFLYRKYRTTETLSRDFINRVTEDIGIPFVMVGEQTSQSAALAASWDRTAPMPKITGEKDFWITSSTHLRTSWERIAFEASKRGKRTFHLKSNEGVSVDFLTSEVQLYFYARTDQFEAVELPGKQASILLVLPPANTTIEQMEAMIASQPDVVESRLTRTEADVTLPAFHLVFEAELRSSIEKLGVHRIFTDLRSLEPMAPGLGGIVAGIAQKTEITLDENGIRADSGTILSGVLGGLIAGRPEPFHIIMDRPFLFFVRDNLTKALIFEGAVMNPALQ